jgi:hypothetical protein
MRGLAVVAIAACGRIGFDSVSPGGGDGGGPLGDTGSKGDGAPAAIMHQSGFGSVPGPGRTEFIPLQASAAGDAVVIMIGCAGNNEPTAASMSAPGWTFTQLVGVNGGAPGPWAATFGAIAPNANATTATGVFTVQSTCQGSMAYVGDVFSNTDQSGGSMTFDGTGGANGGGNCDGTVVTGSADETIWAACMAAMVTGAGPGYMQSQGGGVGSEYEMTTVPAGTTVDAPFVSSGTNVMMVVAIRPAG